MGRRVSEWRPLPLELRPSHLWPMLALGWLALVVAISYLGTFFKTSWMLLFIGLATGPGVLLYLWPARIRSRILKEIDSKTPGDSIRARVSVFLRGVLLGSDVGVLYISGGNLNFSGLQAEFSLPTTAFFRDQRDEKVGKRRHVAVDSVVRDFSVCLCDYETASQKPSTRKCESLLEDFFSQAPVRGSAATYPPTALKKSAIIRPWALLSGPAAIIWVALLIPTLGRGHVQVISCMHLVVALGGLGEAWYLTRYYFLQRRLQKAFLASGGSLSHSEA